MEVPAVEVYVARAAFLGKHGRIHTLPGSQVQPRQQQGHLPCHPGLFFHERQMEWNERKVKGGVHLIMKFLWKLTESHRSYVETDEICF